MGDNMNPVPFCDKGLHLIFELFDACGLGPSPVGKEFMSIVAIASEIFRDLVPIIFKMKNALGAMQKYNGVAGDKTI